MAMRVTSTSFYSLALQQSAKRKAIAQAAIDRSDTLRNAMTTSIQSFTAGQVQLSEMVLRSRSKTQAATALSKLA